MKIYLLSVHNIGNNFGTTLQACALYDYVHNIEPDTKIINYRPEYTYNKGKFGQLVKSLLYFRDSRIQRARYRKYYQEHASLTKEVHSYPELSQFNDGDLYIIGSDQVWNPSYRCGQDPAFYLQFVKGNKIAYSASVGQELTAPELDRLCRLISEFRSLGVREGCTVKQLEQRNISSMHVVDPVFLHERSYYIDPGFKKPFDHYILVYAVTFDQNMEDTLKKLKSILNMKIVLLGGYRLKYTCDLYFRSAGPSEFVNLIRECDFFLANSFHGTAFSLIFEKQFAAIAPPVASMRIESLLGRLNLTDRIITGPMGLSQVINTPINYSQVTPLLQDWCEESKTFLNESIEQFSI